MTRLYNCLMFSKAFPVYGLLKALISASGVMTSFYVGLNLRLMCQSETSMSTIVLFGRAISLFGSEPCPILGADTRGRFPRGSEPVLSEN